jgi:hypothetical protein
MGGIKLAVLKRTSEMTTQELQEFLSARVRQDAATRRRSNRWPCPDARGRSLSRSELVIAGGTLQS